MAVAALIDRGIARLQSSLMVRQSVLVFAATMVMNLGGFVFHAIASRRLGVADYGILYALISTCMIAALPAALAAPVVARFAAEFRVLHDDRHLRRLVLDVVVIFGCLGVAYVLFASIAMHWAGAFLHVPAWAVPPAAVIALGLLLVGVLRAVSQGTQEYGSFALSFVADGTAKVTGILAFTVLLGLGLLGSILGFMAGIFGGGAAIALTLSKRYRGVERFRIRYDWRRIAIFGTGSAAITISGALIGSADVVLVKHFFDADLAGMYAAASLGGKVLLYFVAFLPMVLLPQATERHVRGQHTRYALATSVGLLVVIAVIGLVGLKFFGILCSTRWSAEPSTVPLRCCCRTVSP